MKNRSAKGFFITGTGTGVGKTYVSRVLAEAFSSRMPVSYMKPVQTGCEKRKEGGIMAPDFEYVKKSKVLVVGNEEFHVPYRFLPACSPHLAARKAKEKISLSKIKNSLCRIMGLFGASRGCVLVEGSGGVLVPITTSENTAHLILRLGLPVVLVTTSGLGTLNHTFLSLCALRSIGARIAGIVMNSPEKIPHDYIYKDNRETIRSFIRPLPFLEVEYKKKDAKGILDFCNELSERYL